MLDARGDARGLGVALLDARRQNLQPPPKLSLSAWAGRYAVLSRETSAQTGRFKAFAYQTGIMDAVTDPRVTHITVMKSARVGYTKILDHVIGYLSTKTPHPFWRCSRGSKMRRTTARARLRRCCGIRRFCPPLQATRKRKTARRRF